MRDGHSSESISFAHRRGAHNTKGVNRETVGSAGPRFEIVGPENAMPAPGAVPGASAPPGSVASIPRGRHQAAVDAPGTISFSRGPAPDLMSRLRGLFSGRS